MNHRQTSLLSLLALLLTLAALFAGCAKPTGSSASASVSRPLQGVSSAVSSGSSGAEAASMPPASSSAPASSVPPSSTPSSTPSTPASPPATSTPASQASTPSVPQAQTVSISIDGTPGGATKTYSYTIEIQSGDTVFSVLQRAVSKGSLSYTGSGKTAFVTAIYGVANAPSGVSKGWIYTVNGTRPAKSCGAYAVNDGDKIEWVYSTQGY